ncbi:MAG TPA: bifunctional 5,10-methylenetetrahydrofolate dehydrogenase/5,10-methenyltetrahydrofolate cyclohydrolase [Candidatus Paceibacterota bacterium]|nr:bifunctional 5,10-methylenetetrahydrofolate dehydrogenase/5,10-methenyltetrahydrofolate cyclohydrolase [Candidatus Paceibacterota bacterium]
MTIIIDGKKMRGEMLEKTKEEISLLSFQPVFSDVLVGSDPASVQYVDMKAKTAERIGIRFHRAQFPADISALVLMEEIKKLKDVPGMCGVIVQLPLPSGLAEHREEILNSVPEEIDVDCLGEKASQRFYEGKNEVGFPTALACMAILDSINIDLMGKKIAVLGQGDLVGKPVTALLRFRGLEPVTVRSSTEDKEKIIKEADVIISGIGRGKYITGDMIKEGAVIIDAGTSESNGGIVGDVDLESVRGVASFVSPVPGGVGPVTVAMLLGNVLKVAKKRGK